MKRTILLMVALMILGGCATFSDQYKSGQAMPQEQVNRIMNAYQNGEIKIGMTKEEVIKLIGEPSIRYPMTFGKIEIWIYTSHSSLYDAFVGTSRPLEIHFDKNGKLTLISRQFRL